MLVDTTTQVCAVIGNPVGHSLSPAVHNAAFQAAGLNYVYVAFRVEDVGACLAGMRVCQGFRGMSVTIPHKRAVIPHLDELEPMAAAVGSVNTIVNDNGRLIGFTTDGLGALHALSEAGVKLDGRSVLFVGAGGAVRAVAFAFLDRVKPARLTVLGRTAVRVKALVDELAARAGGVKVEAADLRVDLERAMAEHDVVIQGTPAGMYPEWMGATLVPAELLRPEHVVFDMVYRPIKTRLAREAEDAGCQVVLGLEMLLNQATLQFELWTNAPAPANAMRQALVSALNKDP
ncbi:MAG TPA: shikimate dehydrogenase [Candidatus Bathyarchaeia archaeon]|nr:shikimate dehydrogenase [Candidatus Bathyarchaeia archaeon]